MTNKKVKSINSDSISKRFDFAEKDVSFRNKWNDLGIHNYDRSSPREKNYVIDSPPPTASGELHQGHIFSYTHQDLIARYKRMNFWNVVYPMGWDDNGLPTERRVQNYFNVRTNPNIKYVENFDVQEEKKRLNLKSKNQLEISRGNFIELCHKVTEEDEKAFKNLFERLGLSIDWEEEYSTIDNKSRRISQRSFLDLYNKGHIYNHELPTMWDVDFQTAVAQAEVEDRNKQGAFHDIEFSVLSDDNSESFVISTTRPELLPACVAVTAHPDDSRYKHLFGKHAITPCFFSKVPIFASDKVDPEKGTGILMVCTFGDQVDVEWWREQKLMLKQIIDQSGRVMKIDFHGSDDLQEWFSFNPKVANLNYEKIIGKKIYQAKSLLVDMLKDPKNSFGSNLPPLKSDPRIVDHTVRYYEKGDNPIEYLTSRQWFVKIMDKKDQLLNQGSKVNWFPDFMEKRYSNWRDGLAHDWAISRQRYIGVPIPIWYRLDKNGDRIFGNYILADESMLPVDPVEKNPPGFEESQRGKPNGFDAEKDVLDTWFTSSITPQIVANWGEKNDRMDLLYPMDLRPQAHEIIRTWAFYTIVKSMLHQNNIPWKNAAISGFILDPDRKKMSKSKGNVVTPIPLLEQHGSDAVRYWASNARLGMDMAYDESMFKIGGKLVTKLFNAAKFVLSQEGFEGEISNELDLAFVYELKEVVRKSTIAFEKYDFAIALQIIEDFFWRGFTDNYLELVKTRIRDDSDAIGQSSGLSTLRFGLNVFLRIFAPFLPTITDEIWSWVFAEEVDLKSIHIAPWPIVYLCSDFQMNLSHEFVDLNKDLKYDFSTISDPRNIYSFSAACAAISSIRKSKNSLGIGLGAQLENVKIFTDEKGMSELELVLKDVSSAARTENIEMVFTENDGDSKYESEIR